MEDCIKETSVQYCYDRTFTVYLSVSTQVRCKMMIHMILMPTAESTFSAATKVVPKLHSADQKR